MPLCASCNWGVVEPGSLAAGIAKNWLMIVLIHLVPCSQAQVSTSELHASARPFVTVPTQSLASGCGLYASGS